MQISISNIKFLKINTPNFADILLKIIQYKKQEKKNEQSVKGHEKVDKKKRETFNKNRYLVLGFSIGIINK